MNRRSALNAALTAVAVAGLAVVAWSAFRAPEAIPWYAPLLIPAMLTPLVAGLLLLARRPRNAIGTLLVAYSATIAALTGVGALLDVAESARGFGPALTGWLVTIDNSVWPWLYVPPALIALRFPDGRLPPHAPRRAGLWVVLPVAGLTAISLVDPDLRFPPGVEPPLPVIPEAARGIVLPLLLAMLASLAMTVRVVRRRYREAAGVERLQLRWFAWSAVSVPLALAICIVVSLVGASEDVFVLAIVVALVAMPVAIALAILRYRLYDIDRLVNRTIVYAVLTGLLALAWGAIVVLVGVVVGGGSDLITAGATLVVALAARPLRDRVQHAVDRRFARDRVEALAKIDAFLDQVRAGDKLPEDVGEVLAAALDDAALEVRFVLPESELVTDAAGRPAPPPQVGEGRLVTEVRHGPAVIGFVSHSERLAEQPMLLDGVIERAGLAIEIARLRAEVARQLVEVRESRRRIVEAQDEERRRMERDLHDGAQQRLVSLGLALRHVQHVLPTEHDDIQGMLDDAVGEISAAVTDLRELARGVRPAPLNDGLLVALRDLARRAPAGVSVNVTAGPERYAEPIEAAAWFTAAEALTNAVKHAEATKVDIAIEQHDATLALTVSDDGTGGAEIVAGGGLAGLSDRISALGGHLRVRSDATGTLLLAEFPCAS